MYIKSIEIENYGPINKLSIKPRFNQDGSPIPIILMGKNGSGKTLVLSHVLQALLNNKSKLYDDIPEKEKNQLYKIISISDIKNNKQEGLVSIKFDDNDFNYTEIISKNPIDTIDKNVFPEFTNALKNNSKFKEKGMYEKINGTLNYDENVCLYFPVDRYYIPYWKNKEITNGLRIEDHYVGKSLRNIICNSIQKDFEPYILNTIIDKELYDNKQFIKKENNFVLDKEGNPVIVYSGKNSNILEFINSIISEFKNKKYIRQRLYVSEKENRKIGIVGIKEDNSEEKVIESFSKLSTGEYALLSLFTAIIIDYDKTIKKEKFNFQNIKGIVLIDEAELNLHIDLQMNVLPKLMKKFKNIQFIVTTQSPFFIYGVDDVYKKDCDIYDMPTGTVISNMMDLSEIKKSYDAMISHHEKLSEQMNDIIEEVINNHTDLIVITEGKTDPIYLNKAIEKLEKYQNKKIKIIGLKTKDANKYQEEGWTALNKLADALTVVSPIIPTIFMYDRDVCNNELLKNKFIRYSKNIYKMSIPVPGHRTDSKELCIEHYFKDSELKRTDSNGRRLYLGNEFNKNGISFEGSLMCKAIDKCGKNSLKIIDGSGKTKVYDQHDELMKNVALSKKTFAEYIRDDKENFNDFDFSEFNKIFDIFDMILKDKKSKQTYNLSNEQD